MRTHSSLAIKSNNTKEKRSFIMATNKWNATTGQVKHTVGNITSSHKYIQDLPNGALFIEDVDNFTVAELGFNADGERTAKKLTDAKKEGVLVSAPERRYLGETLAEFYVGEGERGRVVYFTKGLRFHSSAFAKHTGVSTIEEGAFAHFDVTTGKFLIHDGSHTDYATAKNKFLVLTGEDNLYHALGVSAVHLEVI